MNPPIERFISLRGPSQHGTAPIPAETCRKVLVCVGISAFCSFSVNNWECGTEQGRAEYRVLCTPPLSHPQRKALPMPDTVSASTVRAEQGNLFKTEPAVSDAAIRAAEVIILADDSLPYWRFPIYCRSRYAKFVNRIVVKVHANTPGEVGAWRDRVHRVCAEHPAG